MKQRHRTNDNSLYSLYHYGQDERETLWTKKHKITSSWPQMFHLCLTMWKPVSSKEKWMLTLWPKVWFSHVFSLTIRGYHSLSSPYPFYVQGPRCSIPHAVPFHRPNVFGAVRPQQKRQKRHVFGNKIVRLGSLDLLTFSPKMSTVFWYVFIIICFLWEVVYDLYVLVHMHTPTVKYIYHISTQYHLSVSKL